MGIPLLFGFLARKYRNVHLTYTFDKEKGEECDNFFIDYNGLIHKIINDLKEEVSDDIIFNSILSYTIKLCDIVKPKKRLVIAVDGVAPRAKMNQQRMRRFKSSLNSDNSATFFDRNKVTPGTDFMDKLDKFLRNNIYKINVKEVVFSGVNEPGEGEHKIMEYIRHNLKELGEDYNILQGLDCVTGDTPVLLKNPGGYIEILNINMLNDKWETREDGKEYGDVNFQIWTEKGWTNINKIRRCKTTKDIYRINTNSGCIDVTEDHTMLTKECQNVFSKDCIINDKLLHSFPLLKENFKDIKVDDRMNVKDLWGKAKELNIKKYQRIKKDDLIEKINNYYAGVIQEESKVCNSITEEEAYIMGLWWADGTAGIYTYKNKNNKYKDGVNVTYQWYISNCDLDLLNRVKILIEKCYNVKCSFIEDKSHVIRKENRNPSWKLKILGGKNIKCIIDKYSRLFYYKNKESSYKQGNKYIHFSILNSKKSIREAFFEGYYNGDGKGHNLLTKRKSMDVEGKISAQCIYYLSKSIGYNVSINTRDDKPNIYRFIITKRSQLNNPDCIKKIKNIGKTDEYVYDLLTENHHFQAGIGEMIIHNCDLIMLTSSVDLKFKLLREEQNKKDVLTVFDVNLFKSLLLKDIQSRTHIALKHQNFIRDFIVITFFLGNDFLPRLPALKIKNNGVNILLNTYCKMFSNGLLNKETYLVYDNGTINMYLFKKFIQILSDGENYQIQLEKIDKQTYYSEVFKTCDEQFITEVSKKYTEGIQWVAEYYFNGVKDYHWYYPYYYSVFASDILNIEKSHFKNNSPFSPLQQLVCVLPVKSLPENYKNKINNEVKYMFPDKFLIDNRDSDIPEHARNAIIPFVDTDTLFKVMGLN